MATGSTTPGRHSPDGDHDEPTARRDKFQTERGDDPPAATEEAMEVDEFGRSRKRRERSRTRSNSPPSHHVERRGKRRRSRSRDVYIPDYRGRTDSYAPRYNNGHGPMDMPHGYYPPNIDHYEPGMRDRERQSLPDPMNLDFLVAKESFAEYLKQQNKKKRSPDTMSDDEIDRRFDIYKENWTIKQQQKFFEKEKDNEWFREKYHPEESKPLREEVNRRKREEVLVKFKAEFAQGKYDDVNYDASKAAEETKEEGGKEDEIKDEGGNPDTAVVADDVMIVDEPVAAESAENSKEDGEKKEETKPEDAKPEEPIFALFIKAIQSTIKRSELLEKCKQVEGFKWLVMSDPKPEHRMRRLGWVIFEEGTDMKKAQETLEGAKIKDFILHFAQHSIQEKKTRFTPVDANKPERLHHDYDQIRKLAEELDNESAIPAEEGAGVIEERLNSVIFPAIEKDHEGDDAMETAKHKKGVDMYITYLRNVHYYDYYSGTETWSPEDFGRRGGIYLRRQETTDSKSNKPWLDRLDLRIDLRIRKPLEGREILKLGGRDLQAELDKHLTKYVKKESEGKYRCTDCSKLFKGEEFVRKHLKTKHPERCTDTKKEVEFYNNYVRDACKIDVAKMAAWVVGQQGHQMQSFGYLPFVYGGMNLGSQGQGGMSAWQMGQVMQQAFGVGPYAKGGRGSRGGRGSVQSRLGPVERNERPQEPVRRASRSDPRQLRRYDDLDNPVPSGEIEISYD